jgi:hypothetical protein
MILGIWTDYSLARRASEGRSTQLTTEQVSESSRPTPGRIIGYPYNPPTEPDVKVSLIRFLGDGERYASVSITLLPADTS